MYQALYNKYRPTDFSDVISQPHITTTLRNQIRNGNTAHAYIFTGSRGTGKTTCARILAKALNCENPVDGNPCNKCRNCIDADNFALSDIIELDAASHGGIDDARDLRGEAEYLPERCKYKIYIIDEVHMLSTAAFNGLLKLIEEPPAHVRFIMATTEIHKVIATILSRCQRFDFRRIKTEDITARIGEIAVKEGINLDADAAGLIARTADGGMRDALSILDRCVAFSNDVTTDIVARSTGLAGRSELYELAQHLCGRNVSECLRITDELHSGSKDLRELTSELISLFRDVLVAIAAPQMTDIFRCLPEEEEVIRKIAAESDTESILRILDILGKTSERMRSSLSKRTDLEMCFIRICSSERKTADSDEINRLSAKIASLEKMISEGSFAVNQPKPQESMKLATEKNTGVKIDTEKCVFIEKWMDCVEEIRRVRPDLGAFFAGSSGYSMGADTLVVNSDRPGLPMILRNKDNRLPVQRAIFDVTGGRYPNVIPTYREELDRSGVKKAETDTVRKGFTADDILRKAGENGIPVETV